MPNVITYFFHGFIDISLANLQFVFLFGPNKNTAIILNYNETTG